MKAFACGRCGQAVYYENHSCGACGAWLGFDPGARRMLALEPQAPAAAGAPVDGGQADSQALVALGSDGGSRWRVCANRFQPAACNWLMPDPAPQPSVQAPVLDASAAPGSVAPPAPADAVAPAPAVLCPSCRLTRVIPDLGQPGHADHWRRIEQAKRRMLFTLVGMGLMPEPKQGPDDRLGLAFELLAEDPVAAASGQRVLTGHADGVITLNVAEADDATREARRVAMGEPQRTLLGHLRHEVAHYLQYRWLSPEAMDRCRAVFGDERADYGQALARHHAEGAPPDWPQSHISAYASAHPWEDWAETCAHVLLIEDAVETAAAWGLSLQGPAAQLDAAAPGAPASTEDLVLEHWLPVARFINAMNRCIGQPDSYPFHTPDAVLHKMATVRQLLAEAAQARTTPQPLV